MSDHGRPAASPSFSPYMQMLDRYSVIDEERNRRYLLEKTQHLVGGFGKSVGDTPGKANKCRWQSHTDHDQISSTHISDWCH